MNRPFSDRYAAGRVLAETLQEYAGRSDVIVLGLPRGGVPVASEVARILGVPLDVFVVRKLGAPGQEELAMGAVASGEIVVINDEVVEALRGSLGCGRVGNPAATEGAVPARAALPGGAAAAGGCGEGRDPHRRRPGDGFHHACRSAGVAAEAAGEDRGRGSHRGSIHVPRF